MTEASQNNRMSARKRTLLGAKIIFNDGHSVYDCLVKNLSDTGAMIQIETRSQPRAHLTFSFRTTGC